MAKKTQRMTPIELFDTFVPIFCITWVLVFSYIALFIESSLFAMITVMPFFLSTDCIRSVAQFMSTKNSIFSKHSAKIHTNSKSVIARKNLH